jgi:hypothetical protein
MDCRAQKTYHGIVGLESPGLTKGTAITWPDRNPHREKQKNKTPHPTNQQKQTTPPQEPTNSMLNTNTNQHTKHQHQHPKNPPMLNTNTKSQNKALIQHQMRNYQ